jgi:hypothetical protein
LIAFSPVAKATIWWQEVESLPSPSTNYLGQLRSINSLQLLSSLSKASFVYCGLLKAFKSRQSFNGFKGGTQEAKALPLHTYKVGQLF